MSSLFCIAAVNIALALQVSARPAHAGVSDKLTADQQQIVNTLSTGFAALLADDAAKFDSVIAPGFYIFDGGVRLDRDAILHVIKSLHAAGKHYEWNVNERDVHITGNTAWIAYVNRGSISDQSGTIEQTWLESAFLENQAGPC